MVADCYFCIDDPLNVVKFQAVLCVEARVAARTRHPTSHIKHRLDVEAHTY